METAIAGLLTNAFSCAHYAIMTLQNAPVQCTIKAHINVISQATAALKSVLFMAARTCVLKSQSTLGSANAGTNTGAPKSVLITNCARKDAIMQRILQDIYTFVAHFSVRINALCVKKTVRVKITSTEELISAIVGIIALIPARNMEFVTLC